MSSISSHGSSGPIHPDPTVEAVSLVADLDQQGVVARLIGGTAVQHYGAGQIPTALKRSLKDIDVVTTKKHRKGLTNALTKRGYRPRQQFNATQGDRRMLFQDDHHERQLDVFVDVFEMCHTLVLCDRLAATDVAIPAAELLLTKLQIVQLNHKDASDVLTLLAVLEPTSDDIGLNLARVGLLCGQDWGLHRTVSINLERVSGQLADFDLPQAVTERIFRRLSDLRVVLDNAPKTLKWRARARVGDRARWYELPDEVE